MYPAVVELTFTEPVLQSCLLSELHSTVV